MNRFAKYVWLVLGYNLLVVMWGAYVRASGAGAGCGSHWPTCNGGVIPRAEQIETIIEFTHRLTSGLALISVVIMLIWAFQVFEKKSVVRKGAVLAVVFMVIEALLGASLVLLEHVAHNKSIARGFSISLHLVNTFLLLAAIALTAWWASGGKSLRFRNQGILFPAILVGLFGVIVLGASGAIAALGDTLFPATTFSEGLTQDFSSTAHIFLRLRIIHPFLAPVVAIYLVALAMFVNLSRPNAWTKRWSFTLVGLIIFQLTIGLINLFLLAPIPLQLIHLLMADLTWIALVLLSATALAEREEFAEKISSSNLSPQFSSSTN
jgi:heme A synthase